MLSHTRYLPTVAVAAVALAFTACSSSPPPSATPVTVTITQSATSPSSSRPSSVTNTESATTHARPTIGLKVGQVAKFDDGQTVQVLQVKSAIKARGAHTGERWFGVLAKTCLPAEGSLSWSPWVVLDGDQGQYPASNESYGDWPRPEYPFSGEPMAAGCRKGWILFGVPKGTEVARVGYAVDPNGDGTEIRVASWIV